MRSLQVIFFVLGIAGVSTVATETENGEETVFLKDYSPSDFRVENIDLTFDLGADDTMVLSKMTFRRQNKEKKDLELDGENVSLTSVFLNDVEVKNKEEKNLLEEEKNDVESKVGNKEKKAVDQEEKAVDNGDNENMKTDKTKRVVDEKEVREKEANTKEVVDNGGDENMKVGKTKRDVNEKKAMDEDEKKAVDNGDNKNIKNGKANDGTKNLRNNTSVEGTDGKNVEEKNENLEKKNEGDSMQTEIVSSDLEKDKISNKDIVENENFHEEKRQLQRRRRERVRSRGRDSDDDISGQPEVYSVGHETTYMGPSSSNAYESSALPSSEYPSTTFFPSYSGSSSFPPAHPFSSLPPAQPFSSLPMHQSFSEGAYVPPSSQYVSTSYPTIYAPSPSSSELSKNSLNEKPYYIIRKGKLVIPKQFLPERMEEKFIVTIRVTIHPSKNLTLEGLYQSRALLITQCEPQGFRHITYFLDRPDVLTQYRVTLIANKKLYPVLLSNGDLIEHGDLPEGRHFAMFFDSVPKPSYLFALVAGQLYSLTDTFTTMSGKTVTLKLFSEHDNTELLEWANTSAKQAMKWEEDTFGLEYDLKQYYLVAVNDFNAGAMENKGLNIFSEEVLIADQSRTTDDGYNVIRRVIGHEYFHNYSGDRVTIRDWFQLTSKEGLTSSRELLFAQDMGSKLSNLVENVNLLEAVQFPEDAGPFSHPIQPSSYVKIDNFYTTTVYKKGAAVHRMYLAILGRDGFRKGFRNYIQKYDGKGATCDDLRNSMAEANSVDLNQFKLWYTQAGTPEVTVSDIKYEPEKKTFTFKVSQKIASTPNQPNKQPLQIPILIGLIGKKSKRDLLSNKTRLIQLKGYETVFRFTDVNEDCVLSFLRDYSAPVKVNIPLSFEDKIFLLENDSDSFNRWYVSKSLFKEFILHRVQQIQGDNSKRKKAKEDAKFESFASALKSILTSESIPADEIPLLVKFPLKAVINESMEVEDHESVGAAYDAVRLDIYRALRPTIDKIYEDLSEVVEKHQSLSQEDMNLRALRNALLFYKSAEKNEEAAKLLYDHYMSAKNLNDRFPAMLLIADIPGALREEVLADFYEKSRGIDGLMAKYFFVQAISDVPEVLDNIEKLSRNPEFSWKNPKIFTAFFVAGLAKNYKHFNRKDGKGYQLMVDAIKEVNEINPSTAARGAKTLIDFKKKDPERKAMVIKALKELQDYPKLKANAQEVVEKALDGV